MKAHILENLFNFNQYNMLYQYTHYTTTYMMHYGTRKYGSLPLEHKNINWRKYRTKHEQVFDDVYAYFTIEKTKGFYKLRNLTTENSLL